MLKSPILTFAFVLVALLLPSTVFAQNLDISTLSDGDLATRTVQIFVLITVLSLVPGVGIMVTCFPFIITVFAILRQAIGLQQSPPNMLLVALAVFLTYFVMEPVFTDAWQAGVEPLIAGSIDMHQAIQNGIEPIRLFLEQQVDIDTMRDLAALRPDLPKSTNISNMPLSVLVPSFMLSEISHAFQVGFLIYMPFLIIDLVVAAVLMSMGMMMVPPALVSLPFKLAFFVVADGWSLIASSLVTSYL